MKTLVFFAAGAVSDVRRLVREGATILACSEEAEKALQAAGIPHLSLARQTSASDQERFDEAAIAWTKDFGRRPVQDGLCLRDLYSWKGVSLWWFMELYLHHSTRSPGYVRLLETFFHLLEQGQPTEVEACGLPAEDAVLLQRACLAKGVLYAGGAEGRPDTARRRRTVLAQARTEGLKLRASALKARLFRQAAPPGEKPRGGALFLSHAAFWREREKDGARSPYEHYFDRVLEAAAADEELRPFVLAVGPQAAHRRRTLGRRLREWTRLVPEDGPFVHVNHYLDAEVVRAVLSVRRQMHEAWRTLSTSPALRDLFSHRGVVFADLGAPDLAGTLLLQAPWAVRSYEEMAAVLRAEKPAVVTLYAESSGWGRATVAACRAAGVPTVAVQHGILYPGYYSYRHESDEGACPLPDRTAVFGTEAQELLMGMGRYPANALVVTGSPKFDALLETVQALDRDALRARLGVPLGERLLVVASRFHGIRGTHQAMGTAFPALVAAVERLGIRALVKPHPAEPAKGYRDVLEASRSTRTILAAPGEDLVELLVAADALCTVESLSAVEALVLGLSVVILNTPNNLRRMVEAGVALGVGVGEDPAAALQAALFDEGARHRLQEARTRYLGALAHGVDGQATARILALLRETAKTGRLTA